MTAAITTTEIFLIAMGIIFTVPYVIWRVLRTDYYAPLVVVQIILTVPMVAGRLRRASSSSKRPEGGRAGGGTAAER